MMLDDASKVLQHDRDVTQITDHRWLGTPVRDDHEDMLNLGDTTQHIYQNQPAQQNPGVMRWLVPLLASFGVGCGLLTGGYMVAEAIKSQPAPVTIEQPAPVEPVQDTDTDTIFELRLAD